MGELQPAQLLLQAVEPFEQPSGRFAAQRLFEGDARREILQHQIAAALHPCGIHPVQFVGQNAVGGQPVGIQTADLRGGSFDGGNGRRREGQRQQPAVAVPLDFGLGEAGCPHQLRQSVPAGDDTCIRKPGEGQVGRQQRPGKGLDRRCHGRVIRS